MVVRGYLLCLSLVLAGYAILGRGFAHIGGGPIYISELLLLGGLGLMLVSGQCLHLMRSPIIWILSVFVFWSFMRTLPFISVYGTDALRDAVAWGYAAFAMIVGALLLRNDNLKRALHTYARLIPWIIIFSAIAYAIGKRFDTSYISNIFHLGFGPTVSFIDPKATDIAVHLAGAGVFMLLGLRFYFLGRVQSLKWHDVLWWIAWVIGFLQSASAQRGGMIAIMLALAIMSIFQPQRQLLKMFALLLLVFALMLVFDVKIPTGHGERVISAMQFVDNIRSIYTSTEQRELGQTSSDRLFWWKEIINYTFNGPYFWSGKGYGILLALVDHGGDWGLHRELVSRSPHNAHLNILARSGVPGLLLWAATLFATAATAILGTIRNLKRGDKVLARVYLFLVCYGSAALVNMTFDVFLEGPQGGIWFWTLIGVVIATRENERRNYEIAQSMANQSSRWVHPISTHS